MKNNTIEHKWHVLDANDKILGRLSTEAVDLLRGKNKVDFAPNRLGGDKVVIINSKMIKVSGKKEEAKKYYHYSGFHKGLKTISLGDLRKTDPNKIIFMAIKGMLPKNKLQSEFLKNLYIYADAEHPHTNVKFD